MEGQQVLELPPRAPGGACRSWRCLPEVLELPAGIPAGPSAPLPGHCWSLLPC
ncbi:hypothetical protein Nmel_010118, partial [Mimus melanotis]